MPDRCDNPTPLPTDVSTDSGHAPRLAQLLAACVAADGSDLHLSPGLPPLLRVHGVLEPVAGEPALTADDTLELGDAVLGERAADWGRGSVDGALSSPDGVRFRYNVFRRQGAVAVALRRLEDRFRSLAELGLPESLHSLCDLRDGLVVVAGPTGAGKSTTLATLLDRINRTRPDHIVTIEDPIEYLHKPVKCLVNQREVGSDAPGFNDALVASLRQDPDVILVGEVRDLDTIRTAITAAETGHLVFTTVHAGDCVGAVERLVGVFPAGEQEGIRRQLSLVLRAIVAQHLLPAAGESVRTRRYVASEVLINNAAVANLITTGKSNQIYSTMEASSSQGMQTLEQDLARLWVGGRITEAAAAACARNVAILRDRAAILRKRAAPGPGR